PRGGDPSAETTRFVQRRRPIRRCPYGPLLGNSHASPAPADKSREANKGRDPGGRRRGNTTDGVSVMVPVCQQAGRGDGREGSIFRSRAPEILELAIEVSL